MGAVRIDVPSFKKPFMPKNICLNVSPGPATQSFGKKRQYEAVRLVMTNREV